MPLTELSDFAKEVNEARRPGHTLPERVWAHGIVEGLCAYHRPPFGVISGEPMTYIAPNGDRFSVRFLRFNEPLEVPRRLYEHSINGQVVSERDFEVRLAENFPERDVGLNGSQD